MTGLNREETTQQNNKKSRRRKDACFGLVGNNLLFIPDEYNYLDGCFINLIVVNNLPF